MTVVILDTNALPHGQFSERVLDRLIAVAGRGASVVVPEIVVWEWAEHAHLAQEALAEAVSQHRVDELLAPRPAALEVASVDTLVERIGAALQGRATIWTPPDTIWRKSLRQQILQVGTGERKAGVKTGAADAIVLACVEAELDSADGAVVLLTSDGGLRAACRTTCPDALMANGIGQLLDRLNTFEPAAEDLALRAEEELPLFFNERIGDGMEPLRFDDLGVEYRSGSIQLGPRTKPQLATAYVSHVDIAEVDNFRTAVSDSDRYGLAELRIFGDVAIEVVEQVEVAPGHYVAMPKVLPVQMAHIDVTVAIRWNHNWQLEGIEPTGVAIVVQSTVEELDEEEVPAFLATELRTPVIAESES